MLLALCRRGSLTRSRIHEREISNCVEASGQILRVRRLEVSVYNVYITNQFQHTFAGGGGGGLNTVNSKEENSGDFCPNYGQEFSLRVRCAGGQPQTYV
jgi:hypothetical protein